MPQIKYSIIIPVYNEEESIIPVLQEILSAIKPLKEPFEIIVIDDHSSDSTATRLRENKPSIPQLHILQLTERSGQSAALFAGIFSAKGAFSIILDGDGQNDPKDILPLISALPDGGFSTGIRINRCDTWQKRYCSFLANHIRRFVFKDSIQDTGCSLKIVPTAALQKVPYFSGVHRFIPSLLLSFGLPCTQIPVNHRARKTGKSKYGILNRAFISLFDLCGVFWLKKRIKAIKLESI